MSEPQAIIAPAPVHTPSMAATMGCGQARMAFTRSPVMRVNSEQLGHVHLHQRPDDLVHVAAAAEVAALAGEDDGLDVGGVAHLAEQVAQLAVGIEGGGSCDRAG